MESKTYYFSCLVKSIDVYVVVEYTVTVVLPGEAYCIIHLVCLVDIIFSGAEKASTKRIRNFQSGETTVLR